jgi:hypothetical protein
MVLKRIGQIGSIEKDLRSPRRSGNMFCQFVMFTLDYVGKAP